MVELLKICLWLSPSEFPSDSLLLNIRGLSVGRDYIAVAKLTKNKSWRMRLSVYTESELMKKVELALN